MTDRQITMGWPKVSHRHENRLLRLADEGARQAHYITAAAFPDRYPGHVGGSWDCPHRDCRIVRDAVVEAVTMKRLV